MSSLSSFFEKRGKAKDNSALSQLFSSSNNSKFQNLVKEENPSTVVYLKPQEQKDEPQNLQSTIFVGNISISTKHKHLKALFKKYGEIEKIWFRSVPVEQNKMGKKANFVLKKYAEGAESMNGYVKFRELESAKAACELNGTLLDNLTIRVFLCLEDNVDTETTIFIGNLPLDVKEEEVRKHFQHLGKIENVRVIKNKFTFQGIGIGYVRFATKAQMQSAISTMNGSLLRDRPLRVKRAIEKAKLEKKARRIEEHKLSKRNYTPPQSKGKKQRIAKRGNQPESTDEKQRARKFHFKRKMIKK